VLWYAVDWNFTLGCGTRSDRYFSRGFDFVAASSVTERRKLRGGISYFRVPEEQGPSKIRDPRDPDVEVEEEFPRDMPKPSGNSIRIYCFVDANDLKK